MVIVRLISKVDLRETEVNVFPFSVNQLRRLIEQSMKALSESSAPSSPHVQM